MMPWLMSHVLLATTHMLCSAGIVEFIVCTFLHTGKQQGSLGRKAQHTGAISLLSADLSNSSATGTRSSALARKFGFCQFLVLTWFANVMSKAVCAIFSCYSFLKTVDTQPGS